MSEIKLLKIDELSDGTQRFQSQLLVGTKTADFIMRSDGIMRCYGYGNKGFDYYEYSKAYQVFLNKSDMFMQPI